LKRKQKALLAAVKFAHKQALTIFIMTSKASHTTRSKNANNGSNMSSESYARPSIAIQMIRHAESRNNQVYGDARRLFRMGTDESDLPGWEKYVNENRRADPDLSEVGQLQAAALTDYLVPLLRDRAAVTDIVMSPMRRTLETIRPTVQALQPLGCRVTVHGFYFETEGCHTNGVAEEGMNPSQIEQLLFPATTDVLVVNEETTDKPEPTSTINVVGFPHEDPSRGWWTKDGSETRAMAEDRAAKFYVWLCEHLDAQLANPDRHAGIFDAGVVENNHDVDDATAVPHAAAAVDSRCRRQRKTQLLIGHGDFMSLILKRIVSGFGHAVEVTGVPHRSAFVHWNTGITELEYFGQGRFLVMHMNSTPHLTHYSGGADHHLLTGGSLKDGWSFLMPHDFNADCARVDVVFSDQELDGSVVEQKAALKALYLSSHATNIGNGNNSNGAKNNSSNPDDENYSVEESDNGVIHHFVVRQGMQVVGVATYAVSTGRVYDVAVRPSAGQSATELLFNAIKDHSKRHGRSNSLLVQPRTEESRQMFESVGFRQSATSEQVSHMEYLH
jgi:Acetyltransferase (GNAT) domain/Histidine phosphatase superfamily (branch 1)